MLKDPNQSLKLIQKVDSALKDKVCEDHTVRLSGWFQVQKRKNIGRTLRPVPL